MKRLQLFLVFLLGCNSQSGTVESHQTLQVGPILEVIDLRDSSEHCTGLLFSVEIRNNTASKVFFPKPEMQAWMVQGDSIELISVFAPIDISLDVYPPGYFHEIQDDDRTRAFSLADTIITRQGFHPEEFEVQRRIFSSSIVFLGPFEKVEVAMGVTFLKEVGKNFKLVAASHDPIDDFDKILGDIPSTFDGYRFHREPLVSDTLALRFR